MSGKTKTGVIKWTVASLLLSVAVIAVFVELASKKAYKTTVATDGQTKPVKKVTHYIVGNINGIPVKIPSGVAPVNIPAYDDTPSMFSSEWKTYKIHKRTYKDNLRSFGFEFKYPENELFSSDVNYAKYREETHKWMDAGVQAWEKSSKMPFDRYFKRHINADRGFPEDDPWGKQGNYYNKTNQTLYGLQVYEVNKDVAKRVARIEDWDIFVHRNDNGEVIGFIECSKQDVAHPPCDHQFLLSDFNGARGTLLYDRHHLEHWQEIQQIAENHLRSWIVEPEKNSVVLK